MKLSISFRNMRISDLWQAKPCSEAMHNDGAGGDFRESPPTFEGLHLESFAPRPLSGTSRPLDIMTGQHFDALHVHFIARWRGTNGVRWHGPYFLIALIAHLFCGPCVLVKEKEVPRAMSLWGARPPADNLKVLRVMGSKWQLSWGTLSASSCRRWVWRCAREGIHAQIDQFVTPLLIRWKNSNEV